MTAVDQRQQFQFEFITGVSLSNESQRLNRINSTIDTNKERHKFHSQQMQSFNEQTKNKQLEIIGLEIGSKMPLNTTNSSSIDRKLRLTRVDQTMLQLPKRTTFMTGRKAQENVLSRTWTSHVPFSSHMNASDKSPSHRRANTSTDTIDDKSIMVQPTGTLNSSITVLKKLATNNNQLSPRSSKKSQQQPVLSLPRDPTSVKLPALVKRAPTSITKPIPSAYIQDSSRLHVPTNTNISRAILHPTPILPIYAPRRSVTIIRDRLIKNNLAQKASFKCKSPLPYRPDSSMSRSTTAVLTSSQLQIKTSNPLKMDVNSLLNEAARNRLKRLFQQLDTDRDGHLTYPQVQKCLPPNLPRAQETFFRVLYDITSDTTFFGLQEFYATAVLVDMVGKQDSHIWDSLLDDVDFNYYRDDILELLEGFDDRYSPITSTINFDNLIALIMNRTSNGKYEQITKELETLIPKIKTMKLNRLEFIALTPVIIYIESLFDQSKSLFRFRENSILDTHIKKALFI